MTSPDKRTGLISFGFGVILEVMTPEEKIRRFEAATAAERYFSGVCGNPVAFARKWGLSLSETYVRSLDTRGKGTRKRATRRKRR